MVRPGALGSCAKCQGQLCMSGTDVVCTVCGLPQTDHPLMAGRTAEKIEERALHVQRSDRPAIHTAPKPATPRGGELPNSKIAVVPETAQTFNARLLALEKGMVSLMESMQKLHAVIEGEGRRKRTA